MKNGLKYYILLKIHITHIFRNEYTCVVFFIRSNVRYTCGQSAITHPCLKWRKNNRDLMANFFACPCMFMHEIFIHENVFVCLIMHVFIFQFSNKKENKLGKKNSAALKKFLKLGHKSNSPKWIIHNSSVHVYETFLKRFLYVFWLCKKAGNYLHWRRAKTRQDIKPMISFYSLGSNYYRDLEIFLEDNWIRGRNFQRWIQEHIKKSEKLAFLRVSKEGRYMSIQIILPSFSNQ